MRASSWLAAYAALSTAGPYKVGYRYYRAIPEFTRASPSRRRPRPADPAELVLTALGPGAVAGKVQERAAQHRQHQGARRRLAVRVSG
jgi:hypothetical protein